MLEFLVYFGCVRLVVNHDVWSDVEFLERVDAVEVLFDGGVEVGDGIYECVVGFGDFGSVFCEHLEFRQHDVLVLVSVPSEVDF